MTDAVLKGASSANVWLERRGAGYVGAGRTSAGTKAVPLGVSTVPEVDTGGAAPENARIRRP